MLVEYDPMVDSGGLGFSAPSTRAEAVASHLRQRILSGELPPGTKLRQLEIAKELNVSTTPVREAFRLIAMDGLVRQDAHRGVEVFRPTTGGVRENYEIRLVLEPLAAEIAAKSPILTGERLDEIEMIQAQMERAGTADERMLCNRRLHLAIYRAADRPTLYSMIEQLRQAADAYVMLLGAWTPAGYDEAADEEHRAIIAALRARSGPKARKAMATHLKHSLEAISTVIAAREAEQGTAADKR